jgi:hypothetical protein
MAKFFFREELEQSSLKNQIRRLMEVHRVMNAEVLSLESGLPENEVRSLLASMAESGEVHRLRPFGYDKDDMDFFRLSHLPRAARGAAWRWRCGRRHNWQYWIENAKRVVKAPVFGQRQNAYS